MRYFTQMASSIASSISSTISEPLLQFYIDHQVKEGQIFTHTNLMNPAMRMYVNGFDRNLLFELYAKDLQRNKDLYLTEKHRMMSPVLIDVDLRFPTTSGISRRYTSTHIMDIARIYGEMLASFVVVDDIDFFVFEKPAPRLESHVVKDGFHMMVPGIVTQPAVQFVVRQNVLLLMKKIRAEIGNQNNLDDMFEEAVIIRNNWSMFGSKTSNGEPYAWSRVIRFNARTRTVATVPRPTPFTALGKVTFFSIHNNETLTEINNDKKAEIDAFQKILNEKQSRKELCSYMVGHTVNVQKNECDNLEQVEDLVKVLHPRRSLDYYSWMCLGWCLRNLDHRLLTAWDEFSKNSRKYRSGDCERLWHHMSVTDSLRIGTLRMWAKADNPVLYNELAINEMRERLHVSLVGTHQSVAHLIHFMFHSDFVCASVKRDAWYEFKNHRWNLDDAGSGIRLRLRTDVVNEYNKAIRLFREEVQMINDVVKRSYLETKMHHASTLCIRLGDKAFQDKVIGLCKYLFEDKKFEEKLDSNTNLIGFEDGVFEMKFGQFREGRREDYASLSNGLMWQEHDANSYISLEIQHYLQQVFPSPNVREYVLMLLVSFLTGKNSEQKFYIWTGTGSNSKSKLVELFEKCMKNYCIKLPVTLVTGKRAASSGCSPEIAACKGKRLAVMQDPEKEQHSILASSRSYRAGTVFTHVRCSKIPFNSRLNSSCCCSAMTYQKSILTTTELGDESLPSNSNQISRIIRKMSTTFQSTGI